jgi:hypothetical protein
MIEQLNVINSQSFYLYCKNELGFLNHEIKDCFSFMEVDKYKNITIDLVEEEIEDSNKNSKRQLGFIVIKEFMIKNNVKQLLFLN